MCLRGQTRLAPTVTSGGIGWNDFPCGIVESRDGRPRSLENDTTVDQLRHPPYQVRLDSSRSTINCAIIIERIDPKTVRLAHHGLKQGSVELTHSGQNSTVDGGGGGWGGSFSLVVFTIRV